MTKIRTNFIYPNLTEVHRQYGASVLSRLVINPEGDYRKTLPPEEEQRRHGVEPSTCFLFSQTHADATYEEKVFGEIDNNYAERFPAQFAKGTPQGGDPLKGSDAIYDHGSVLESSMPFGEDITSWEEYTSWKGVNKDKVIAEGLRDKKIKGRYGVLLFEKNTPLETKYILLEEGLKRGVPCISLWGVQEGDSYALKPQGVQDTHMVEVTYLDKEKKQIHILDTYIPFQKVLPSNYNPDFCLLRFVEKKPTETQISLWSKILELCRKILNLDKQVLETVKPVQTPVEPPKLLSTRERLHNLALSYIGKDASPEDFSTDEFGCANSVSNLINEIVPKFPARIVSTAQLANTLDDCKDFKRTILPKPGCIIVSPRTSTVSGHCGIFTDKNRIISNDSETGLMQNNYSFDGWITAFKDKKGLRILVWEPL